MLRAMTVVTIMSASTAAGAVETPTLEMIAPGSVIDSAPPKGWNHLVVKSIPRLATGDLESLPGTATTTATLFRTVIAADIRPDASGAYRLRRVGLGICMPHQGHDVVVRSATAGRLGISLGTVTSLVLTSAEAELKRGRLIARSPNFAVLRAPAKIAIAGAHHEMLVTYAFLVDETTGELRTVVWAHAPTAKPRPPGRVVLLKDALIYRCGLDVSAGRILGAPVSWSFAMGALPPGRVLPASQALRDRAVGVPKNAAELRALEQALREAIDDARHRDG